MGLIALSAMKNNPLQDGGWVTRAVANHLGAILIKINDSGGLFAQITTIDNQIHHLLQPIPSRLPLHQPHRVHPLIYLWKQFR